MEQERVVWALSGQWTTQHHPTLLENGNILLLDNRGHHGMSKVIEIDPFTQVIAWAYEGTPANGFYTYGVGARIEAEVGATTLVRIIQAGHSFESSEELAAYFGLAGNTSVDKLTVLWPSGTVDEFFDLSVNTTFEVDEGAGVAIFTDGFESGDVSAWSVSVP